MTSTVLTGLVLLLGGVAQAQRTLSCDTLVGYSQDSEVRYLRSAPHGASRPTPHRLAITWSKGVRVFDDHTLAGYQDGSRHLYCGYDPKLEFHLIYQIDESSSRGVLLDDATGKVLPAGE